MLKSLSISNYALIDQVDIRFSKGMSAITGETGSGKSILLGAFGLLLGERADAKSIKHAEQKCIVEAAFDLTGYEMEQFFAAQDLDFDQVTTIRREIAPGGKSRAFINDTPVQLAILRSFAERLVDIHSQHENSLLGNREFQFSVVDAFAGNSQSMQDYALLFADYKKLSRDLEECISNEAAMRQEMDFIQFNLSELEKADLSAANQQELEQELDTLNNAETIRSAIALAVAALDNESQGALHGLAQARTAVNKVASFHKSIADFSKRLESVSIELRELTREMESLGEEITTDERRSEWIGERLSQIYHLQKKHRVESVDALLSLQEELSMRTRGFASFDDKIDDLKKQVEKARTALTEIAGRISADRKAAAVKAEKEVKRYFTDLSLDHAELKMEILPAQDFNAFGLDEIAFLFRANKGGALLPVKQVASGGEISRVMLAIKAAISSHKKLPVLILDEIDQGVSGEVGVKIGNILKEMSEDMQLLVITHLPQIAGKANNHLKVYKTTQGESTSTFVKEISGDDRINELAEMLSGKTITKAAMENARELMQ